jgi:hypothetical protein
VDYDHLRKTVVGYSDSSRYLDVLSSKPTGRGFAFDEGYPERVDFLLDRLNFRLDFFLEIPRGVRTFESS